MIYIEKMDDGEEYEPVVGDLTIEEMTTKIESLCKSLCQTQDLFDAGATFDTIVCYTSGQNRLLYSQITYVIFSWYTNKTIDADEYLENVSQNLISVIEYTKSPEYQNKLKQYEENGDSDNIRNMNNGRKALFKLWDHVHLAKHQYMQLKQTDEEFIEKFNARFEESFSKSSQEKLNEFSKEMNAQLLTLVGIFTALAFMIFGSITGLSNLFSNGDISILRLMILGCIWGIAIINLVFVFLFCVGKITGTRFASTEEPKASIWKKYPIVWWSNTIIIFILIMSCWIYYIKNRKGLVFFDQFLAKHSGWVVVSGTFIIVSLFLLIIHHLRLKTDANVEIK